MSKPPTPTWYWLCLLVILMSVAPGCRKKPPAEPPPPAASEPGSTIGRPDCRQDLKACREDSECVQVAAGCCSCVMGGEDTAINIACREIWVANLGDCSDVMCTAVFRCDPAVKPRCLSNRCVLAAESQPLPEGGITPDSRGGPESSPPP